MKYQIKFHTYWHCGSGLAAGADVDALVVKDKDNLPFIPGKTIKGLIREAVEEISGYCSAKAMTEDEINTIFGKRLTKSVSKNGESRINLDCASAFFSNAELPKEVKDDVRNYIVDDKKVLSDFFYRSVASTAIDGKTGIAQKHSLRKMQVVIPCTLEGEISGISDAQAGKIAEMLGFIKCLGQGRTKGLGRCTISIKKEDTK